MKSKLTILFAILILYMFSCKPVTPEECVEQLETTELRWVSLFKAKNIETDSSVTLNSWLEGNDTVLYNMLGIELSFWFNGFSCDNINVNNIERINVICNENYNLNYSKGDTINDIISIKFNDNSIYTLNEINHTQHKIETYYSLYFTEAPEELHSNSFKIEYFETNNIFYSKTTEKTNIIP